MGWHELFLVEGDSVLPPGDQLLETKLCPMMPNEDASGWLAILDQLGPPNPRSIVAGSRRARRRFSDRDGERDPHGAAGAHVRARAAGSSQRKMPGAFYRRSLKRNIQIGETPTSCRML